MRALDKIDPPLVAFDAPVHRFEEVLERSVILVQLNDP